MDADQNNQMTMFSGLQAVFSVFLVGVFERSDKLLLILSVLNHHL
jgi:hypothetical protein